MLRITAIIPSEPAINPTVLQEAIFSALEETSLEIKQAFEATVASWNEQPKFIVERDGTGYQRLIYTVDQIYEWVNNGTPPHEILPIRAQALRFFTGGMAKTKPGALSSGPGMLGGNMVFAKMVNNPGITARDFDAKIQEEYDEIFPDRMQDSFNRAVTRSLMRSVQ
jgi:hypothetical protein